MGYDTLNVIGVYTPLTAPVPSLEGSAYLYRNSADSNKLWLKYWDGTDYAWDGGPVTIAPQIVIKANAASLQVLTTDELLASIWQISSALDISLTDEVARYSGFVFLPDSAAPNLKNVSVWQKNIEAFFSITTPIPTLQELELLACFGIIDNLEAKFPALRSLRLIGQQELANQAMPASLETLTITNNTNGGYSTAGITFAGTGLKAYTAFNTDSVNIPNLSGQTGMVFLESQQTQITALSGGNLPAGTLLRCIDFRDNSLNAGSVTALVNLVLASTQTVGYFDISGGTNATPSVGEQASLAGLPAGWVVNYNP